MAFIPQGGLPIVPALGFGFQRRVPDLYTAYQQGIPMLFQFDNYNLRGKVCKAPLTYLLAWSVSIRGTFTQKLRSLRHSKTLTLYKRFTL